MRPGFAWLPVLALAALAGVRLRGAGWPAVTAADRAATAPAGEPDAPAIALDWEIQVNDRDYPQTRDTTEYVRYKIFDPERSVGLTRLSEFVASYDGSTLLNADIRARLTLPDGSVREFGREAVRERPLVQALDTPWMRFFGESGQTFRERFLAVSGLVPGAILEVRVARHQTGSGPNYASPLQKSIPVRHVRYVHLLPGTLDYYCRSYVGNGPGTHATLVRDDRRSTDTVTADDLPSVVNEPYSVPLLDRSVCYFLSIGGIQEDYQEVHTEVAVRVKPADGPWAPIAARNYVRQQDEGYLTSFVVRTARRLTAGAGSDAEKAERVHRYVQALFLKYRRSPQNERPFQAYQPPDLSHVAAFDQYPRDPIAPTDFVILELALDRGAGLQAQEALLPDREVMLFDPRLVSAMFLPVQSVRVQCGGAWRFSLPTSVQPLAFGELPWTLQGEPALLVQSGPQTFAFTPRRRPRIRWW